MVNVVQKEINRLDALNEAGLECVEIGTGNVLTGLARRIAPDVKAVSCGTVAEVEKLLELAAANV